jgi:hypothetical protein
MVIDVSPISGHTRVSTYSFSPITGLILKHEIESIYPQPHSAVYDSLKASLLGLMGIKPAMPEEQSGVGGLQGQARALCAPELQRGEEG